MKALLITLAIAGAALAGPVAARTCHEPFTDSHGHKVTDSRGQPILSNEACNRHHRHAPQCVVGKSRLGHCHV